MGGLGLRLITYATVHSTIHEKKQCLDLLSESVRLPAALVECIGHYSTDRRDLSIVVRCGSEIHAFMISYIGSNPNALVSSPLFPSWFHRQVPPNILALLSERSRLAVEVEASAAEVSAFRVMIAQADSN